MLTKTGATHQAGGRCLYGLLNEQWNYFLTEGVVYNLNQATRPAEFVNSEWCDVDIVVQTL